MNGDDVVKLFQAAAILGVVIFLLWFMVQIQKSNAKTRATQMEAIRARNATVVERLQSGKPMDVDTSNIVVQKSETVIWREPAQLIEERVTKREWSGGSKGVSIPTGVLGMKVSLGKTAGRINVERGNVPVATGHLYITNQHIIFSGDGKSTKTPLKKLIDVQCANNGLIMGVTGRQKPLMFLYVNPMVGEVVQAAIQRAYDTQT